MEEKKTNDLFAAIKKGDIAEVERLLNAGADIEARDKWNTTSLHEACFWGRSDIARLLLDRGADPGARSDAGTTSLHTACEWGHTDIVRLLLERGADVGARDIDGDTPLHWACIFSGPEVTSIATLLLDRGADPGAQGEESRTPLDIACDLPESDPYREPLLEIFRDRFPEAWFTKFCESPGRMPGRGM